MGMQVEKSGLITGSRLGADREYEFDELEVHSTCTTYIMQLKGSRDSVQKCVVSVLFLEIDDQWQGRLEELERELLEVNGNAERLARSFSELVELQLVLEKASAFFDDAQSRASTAAFQTGPADTGSAFLLHSIAHSVCYAMVLAGWTVIWVSSGVLCHTPILVP